MTKILMPALSPTMEEGKLAKWLVQEGDTVRAGDILAEIETDKATMEFEAVDEGRIEKILVPAGSAGVKVNQPIAILAIEGEGDADISDSPAKKPDNAPATDIETAMSSIRAAVSAETQTKSENPPKDDAPTNRLFASPLARKLADQKGVDLTTITGTGPRGRVIAADLENAQIAPKSAAPTAPEQLPDASGYFRAEDVEHIPHDSMRKSIARRLTAAKSQIPHYYLTMDCQLDTMLALRTRLNAQDGIKLSVNDFIIKAAAAALQRVPEVNASWTESAILRHKHADIGVAVALDGGLITPIVFHAETKGLAAISAEVKSLAERAKNKKLKPSEFEGGTFAISNLGMFGISHFTAVINPPHAAILAVGAGTERPVIHDGKIEIATVMTVTMSCDHRVIDGATGARFLQSFKTFIEDPASMLL